MTDQKAKANQFHSLHIKGDPLVLYNVWDAGTAKIVANAGAKAIATSSDAIANANSYLDGEQLPLEIVLRNLQLIVDAVDLPVSVDLESGYGRQGALVADTVTQAINVGAIGFNLEDQIIGANALYSIKDQAARIKASRSASEKAGVRAFINARTDVYLQASPNANADDLLADVMERVKAYHQAGADGLFVPGLTEEKSIIELCEMSPIAINIMKLPNCPSSEILATLGVARISYGQLPYHAIMQLVATNAQKIYA